MSQLDVASLGALARPIPLGNLWAKSSQRGPKLASYSEWTISGDLRIDRPDDFTFTAATIGLFWGTVAHNGHTILRSRTA